MENIFSGFTGDLIGAVVIIIITLVINKIVCAFIDKRTSKSKNKDLKTVFIFAKKIIKVFIMFIGIVIALYQFSIFSTLSITLLSATGVLITVIGLALQDSLGNIIGSFEIIMNKPFSVGDFIKLPEKGVSGTVEEVCLRHTVIKTVNNQREIIPNGMLKDLIIENTNFKDNEMVLMEEYAISYDADVENAIEILKEELVRICKIEFKGANKNVEFPKVRVVKWDSSAIKLRAYVWGNDLGEAYDNLFELNKSLKVRYNKAKIEIPYDYINVVNKK